LQLAKNIILAILCARKYIIVAIYKDVNYSNKDKYKLQVKKII